MLADLRTRGWGKYDADTLRVSDTGREAYARWHSAVTATRERLTAGLTAEQYVATVGVLRQMALNLGCTQT